MFIIKKQLTEAEFAPVNQRWNSDCNCVQQTSDGVTWVDAPGLDPRTAPGSLLPAAPTSNPACDGAARMTAAIKGLVNGYLGTASVLEAINSLLAIVLVVLPGYGVLVDILIAVVGALVVIGTLAIIAAMTDEVYATLTCILSCHVGEDGQITQEGVDAAFIDVEAQIGGVAASVIGEFFNVLGANGMSNAAVLRDETGDCDECECDICNDLYDFTLGDELGWYLSPDEQTHVGVLGAWTGTGWVTTFASYFGGEAFGVSFNCDAFHLNFVEVGISAPDNCVIYLYLCNPDGSGLTEVGGGFVGATEYSIQHYDVGSIVPGEPKTLIVFCTTSGADCTLSQVGLNTEIPS